MAEIVLSLAHNPPSVDEEFGIHRHPTSASTIGSNAASVVPTLVDGLHSSFDNVDGVSISLIMLTMLSPTVNGVRYCIFYLRFEIYVGTIDLM